MKTTITCFLLFLVLSFNQVQCSWAGSWIDTISSKVRDVTQYVEETGGSIKNYINGKLAIQDSTYNTVNAEEFSTNAPQVKNEYSDPQIHLTTPELIEFHGFKAETHSIYTEDGYILTVHRIPFPRNTPNNTAPKKTVLLHHGLLGSSADWVLAGPQKGLAYYLSDAGYDVWMANARGSTYSRSHVSGSTQSFEFWNFSFHEISQYDLPALIDYIMRVKNDVKIDYVGHSMGTTALFAMLSTKPHYNKLLRAGYALAPVTFMSDIKSPVKYLSKFSNNIEFLMNILGTNEFLPQNSYWLWPAKSMCEINHFEKAICHNSLFIICGYDESQFNRTLLPIILGHIPAGSSTKMFIHYAQEIENDGRFQQFDYGKEENLKRYDSETPPEYSIQNITLPIALFSGPNDWLSSERDGKNLYAKLPNPIEHYVVPFSEFNHFDFLWAIDAPKLVYRKLLDVMERDTGDI